MFVLQEFFLNTPTPWFLNGVFGSLCQKSLNIIKISAKSLCQKYLWHLGDTYGVTF
jgi:hypothetical protein